jgi:nucleoside-diphosphate-sugar epimerase
MKILITGGAGYIGVILTQALLERGDSVRCYDSLPCGIDPLLPFLRNQRYELVQGDIRDSNGLKDSVQSVDAIVHLAGVVGYPACKRDPELALEVNVRGTQFLNSVRSADQPLIYSSTGSTYGVIESGFCSEATPQNPQTVYGRTKMEAEKILLDSGNAVAYRWATAFGLSPALRLDLMVNDFCFQAVRNRSLIIYQPHARRTFIEVYDIARALIHALDNYDVMRGEPYNCGDEEMKASKLEVAKIIQRYTQLYIHTAEIDKDEDQRDYIVSYDKIRRAGYHTTITLEQGIEQIVNAFQFLHIPNPYIRAGV